MFLMVISKNKIPKLEAYGEIGFGIISDKNDYAPNKPWII